MTTVPQLAQTLQHVFTITADVAARATGFAQRRSKLSGAAFVQARPPSQARRGDPYG